MRTEYKILKTDNLFDIECQINRMLQKGWKPQGGIAIATSINPTKTYVDLSYAQAMIREVPEEKQQC